MNKPIFEEEGQAPAAGMATAQQQIEKKARQLAYDTRYDVKKEIGDKQVAPAVMKQLLLRRLQRSSAAPNVKMRAKQMLLGEDYIKDSKDLALESVANVMYKVFVKNGEVELQEEIELTYLEELAQNPDRKYKVRVTDKKTGNSYVRYATREKISQLRANPNISSVEMTEYGEPREGERKSGEDTARATGGGQKPKLDPVGKEDPQGDVDNDGIPASRDKNDQYLLKRRSAIGAAINKKKNEGVTKEEFLTDAATEDQNDQKITGKGVNNYGGKNPVVKVMPTDPTSERTNNGVGSRSVYAHTELEGELIAETGYSKFLNMIQEKAESEQQQKLFGLALSVKRGETPRSEVSVEVLKIVDTMSEKKIRDFAKTKHEGIPKKKVAEEKECGCDDQPQMKKRKDEIEDMRGLKTKMNLVKNKLRAMGLNMSYELEGEKIDEVAGSLLKLAGAGLGAYAAGKGMEAMKKGVDAKINKARKTSPIGGDRRVPQLNSYELEGDILDEDVNQLINYLINEELVTTEEESIDMLLSLSESALARIVTKALPGVIKGVGNKLTKTKLPPKMDPALKFVKDKIKQQHGAGSLVGTSEYKYSSAQRAAELRKNPPPKPKYTDPFPGDVYSRGDFGIRGYRSGD
jgi:hypothetical protein